MDHDDLKAMTTDQLRADYERLRAAAGWFDKESGRLERDWAQEMKDRKAARKAERDRIMSRKLAAGIALRGAEEREAETARAERIAAEALELPQARDLEPSAEPPIVQTLDQEIGQREQEESEQREHADAQSDEKPLTVNSYASVSTGDILTLIETNAEAINALPDVKPPESRKDAIALLVRAGIRPPAKKSAR